MTAEWTIIVAAVVAMLAGIPFAIRVRRAEHPRFRQPNPQGETSGPSIRA